MSNFFNIFQSALCFIIVPVITPLAFYCSVQAGKWRAMNTFKGEMPDALTKAFNFASILCFVASYTVSLILVYGLIMKENPVFTSTASTMKAMKEEPGFWGSTSLMLALLGVLLGVFTAIRIQVFSEKKHLKRLKARRDDNSQAEEYLTKLARIMAENE